MNMNPPPPPPAGRILLHQLLQTLRRPTTAQQQQQVLQILRGNPQLMTAFIRHRQQQQEARQEAQQNVPVYPPNVVQGPDVNTHFKFCSLDTFNGDTIPFSTVISKSIKRRRMVQEEHDDGDDDGDDGQHLILDPETGRRLLNLNMNKVLGNPMILSIILNYFDTPSLHGLRLVCSMWRDLVTQILVKCNKLTFRYSQPTKNFLLTQRDPSQGQDDAGGTQPQGEQRRLDDFTKFLSNCSHHPFPCAHYEFVGGNLGTRSARSFFSLAKSISPVFIVPIKILTLDGSSFNFPRPGHNVFTKISRLGTLLQYELPYLEKLCIKSLPIERWPEGSQLFSSPGKSLVMLKELEFGAMPWNQVLLLPVMKELIEAAVNLHSVTIHDVASVLDNPESFQFFLSLVSSSSSSSRRPLTIKVNRILYDPFLLMIDRLENFARLKPTIVDTQWPPFPTFAFTSSTREDQRRRLAAIWNILEYNKYHLTSASFSITNLLWLLTNFNRRQPARPIPIFAKLRKLHLTTDNHTTPPAPGEETPPPSPEESLLVSSLCENSVNFAHIFPSLKDLRLSHLFEGRLWESYLELVLLMPKSVGSLYLQDKFDDTSSSTIILRRLQQQFPKLSSLVLCDVHNFPNIASSIWEFEQVKCLCIELRVESSATLCGNFDLAANLDAAFTGFSKDTVVGLLDGSSRESEGESGESSMRFESVDGSGSSDEADELKDLKENLGLIDLPNLEVLQLFFRDDDTFQKPFYNVFSHLTFRHAFQRKQNRRVTLHAPEDSFKNKRNAQTLIASFLRHVAVSLQACDP